MYSFFELTFLEILTKSAFFINVMGKFECKKIVHILRTSFEHLNH